MRFNAQEFARVGDWPQRLIDHRWLLARPESDGSLWTRIRCAWDVLRGRADALYWENQ